MELKNTEQLRFLLDLDTEIHKIQDLDILLEQVLTGARHAVSADAGSIYLVENEKLTIRYSQNDTLSKRLPQGEKLMYSIFSVSINNKTISGCAAGTASLVNIPDAYHIPKDSPFGFDPKFDQMTNYKTVSILAIPLITNTGQVLGVLQTINAKAENGLIRAFTEEDELLVTHYASSATMALQRAQLTRTIILRMIKMAEFRDPKETGPHVNRVAGYATEIYRTWAQKKKFSKDQIDRMADTFKMAAMLHDVGKVGISDLILKKPERFTPEEYEVMKTHTYIGASLFNDKQSDFDAMAAEVALTHHENWDGTGYPGKVNLQTGEPILDETGNQKTLAGTQIPIWGRIVAIADVYDALSCQRVYKKAWKEEQVLEEIRNMKGTKFDPELVDIFFEVLPSLKQIGDRYPG